MPRSATQAAGQTLTFQGIEVPAEAVNPAAFFSLTRRHRNPEKATGFAGLGQTDTVELKKSDIIAGIRVRWVGTVTVALPTGTAASTMRWPYDMPNFRFTANGQSNMINCLGSFLKAREFMAPALDDRSVPQTVGAGIVTNGTLSKSSESWGIGSGANLAAGTYNVELEWFIPIAEDLNTLAGAIFAQTSTMDLNLNIDWQPLSSLFVTTGTATVTLAGNFVVETEKYSIPVVGGNFVIPDLSLFHGYIQSRLANGLVSGAPSEARLAGQGAGKTMLRVPYRVWNGANPQIPLAVNAANYGQQAWRYGSNETPETYQDGMSLRHVNEWEYGTDIGAVFGFMSHDFASSNAFRDVVDMGQTSELRIVATINSSVNLVNPVLEYVQETIYTAGA